VPEPEEPKDALPAALCAKAPLAELPVLLAPPALLGFPPFPAGLPPSLAALPAAPLAPAVAEQSGVSTAAPELPRFDTKKVVLSTTS
jgi:hypothetical protein